MSVTNAMEKTRLSLHHVGRILFAQCAEMVDNRGNRGLPPNLALGDPSLDYCMKGVDISSAAYVSELGFLGNPVSTHIQSAEMHNQAVNSLALISARQTVQSLETLGLLMASYLYVICQALDLRSLQLDTYNTFERVIREEMSPSIASLEPCVLDKMITITCETLDKTTGMDMEARMKKVAKDACSAIIDWALTQPDLPGDFYRSVPEHTKRLSEKFEKELIDLRYKYAKGERSAGSHLGRTKPVYDWVRKARGVPMRAWPGFAAEQGQIPDTIGENVTRIYEGIRDGSFQGVIATLFADL
jgi:phenylalanine ammonia-lyase